MSEKKSFESRFVGKLGYPNAPMNPPPSEEKSTVIQFALTDGCSHDTCTFCNMYRRGFRVKEFTEFKEHVDKVIKYRKPFGGLSKVNRIFLGAGNALSADTGLLLESSQYALKALKNASSKKEIPRRLAVYGNTNDIINKGKRELNELFCGGVCGQGCSARHLGERRGVDLIYWGLESGNSEVLKIAGKGYSQTDIYEAGDILGSVSGAGSHIKTSVMIMPGLGGIAHSESHVHDTVKLLNFIEPSWITFIGLKIKPETPYSLWMEREEKRGLNRRLTSDEITEQTAQIIEGLNFDTTIGVHSDNITPIGHNPTSIGVATIEDRYDAKIVANKLRRFSTEKIEAESKFVFKPLSIIMERFK